MYYSVKGFINNFTDAQKVADKINSYPKLRASAWTSGNTVQFEATLSTVTQRDQLADDLKVMVDTQGGYVVFSECVQNEDGSIGSCTMTHNYRNL